VSLFPVPQNSMVESPEHELKVNSILSLWTLVSAGAILFTTCPLTLTSNVFVAICVPTLAAQSKLNECFPGVNETVCLMHELLFGSNSATQLLPKALL